MPNQGAAPRPIFASIHRYQRLDCKPSIKAALCGHVITTQVDAPIDQWEAQTRLLWAVWVKSVRALIP
jgi:hypothetical protein